MENLEILGSFATRVHGEFRNVFYLLMPLFFGISLALTYVQGPSAGPEFVGAIKRILIANLLLAAFPEITDAILAVTQGIAQKISDMDGFDNYTRMADERTKRIGQSWATYFIAFDDLVIAVLTYLSFLVVVLLRNLMMAVYHFIWILLIILSPILLLLNVFTTKITANLFKSLVEVACWPIVWSVQSAMLTSLAFGDPHKADSGYLSLILMNFVVAAGIVATPLIVRGLLSASFAAAATTVGAAGAAAMLKTPFAAMQASRVGREFLTTMASALPSRTTADYSKGPAAPLSLPRFPNSPRLYPGEGYEPIKIKLKVPPRLESGKGESQPVARSSAITNPRLLPPGPPTLNATDI